MADSLPKTFPPTFPPTFPEEITVQGRVLRIGTRGYTHFTLTDEAAQRHFGRVIRLDPQIYPHALLTEKGDEVIVSYDPRMVEQWERGSSLVPSLSMAEGPVPHPRHTIANIAVTLFRNLTLEAELGVEPTPEETAHDPTAVGVAE